MSELVNVLFQVAVFVILILIQRLVFIRQHFICPLGGAILVGKLKHNGDAPSKQVLSCLVLSCLVLSWLRWCFCFQGCVSVVSVATEAEPVVNMPITCKEAWPEVDATHLTPHVPSPIHHNAAKMTKVKPQSPEPLPDLAPPPPILAPPPHCIQGSLRSADFQHNGEHTAAGPPPSSVNSCRILVLVLMAVSPQVFWVWGPGSRSVQVEAVAPTQVNHDKSGRAQSFLQVLTDFSVA